MVGACQQNSGIFLVRGGEAGQGLGEMPAGAEAGQTAEPPGTGATCLQGSRLGWRRARSEMPAEAEAGLAADRCWVEADAGGGAEAGLGARCRRRPRLGPGRDADDQITGAGREQINSKESAL